MPLKRICIRVSAILISLVVSAPLSWSEEYLSNLGNKWLDPASIGDIEVLDYWYGPFAVYFSTGSGSNHTGFAKIREGVPALPVSTNVAEQFQLDSVTFEFLGSPSSPWTNISMTIQIYQQVGSNSVPVGDLGADTVNPSPTQWPKSTTFIDFHPLTNIVLRPSSDYFVSLSEPPNFPDVFGLLFTFSPHYVTSTDWRMGITTTHVPVPYTEFLKFAVNATAIQGTNSTNGLSTNSTGVAVSNVRLSAKSDGSNIVLSWPSSTATAQLYSSPSFESGSWSPVSAQPVTLNDNLVVTLPLSASGSFFRLQAK
jgi:hypothetical protein